MTWKIQMLDGGRWHDTGGVYDSSTADIRILQFMDACRYKVVENGQYLYSRQFRRVHAEKRLQRTHIVQVSR